MYILPNMQQYEKHIVAMEKGLSEAAGAAKGKMGDVADAAKGKFGGSAAEEKTE